MKKIVEIIILMMLSTLAMGQIGSGLPLNDNDFIYDRYAPRQGLTVAQLLDFPIDSNHFVNVIMLQADNDSAWYALSEEFFVSGGQEAYKVLKEQEKSKFPSVSFWYADHEDPTENAPLDERGKPDKLKACMAVAQVQKHTIWLFYYNTLEESKLLFKVILNKAFPKQ